MNWIFVRHPETEALVKRIIYGHTHSPYTEKGIKSIDWVKEELRDETVTAIYSSPLERTKTLAEAIATVHPHHRVILDERVKEMGVGMFEQMTVDEAREAHPDILPPFLKDFGRVKVQGSELFSEVQERVAAFLDEVTRERATGGKEGVAQGSVIVVSHSMAIRGALAHLFDLDLPALWHVRIKPSAIIKVKSRDGFSVLESLKDPHDIIQ